MTLNLLTYEPLPALAPTQPETRRKPLLALLLSLIFPGLGHLYLRLWRHAAWIIGFELLCLLAIAGGAGQLHAAALITAPALYIFAVVDAYFSAREWNAGVTGWLVGENPRITAILNLTTKGFGYFYLGDRTKGIVCFLAMCFGQALLLQRTNIWTQALAISLQVAIALDGYRVARERLFATHPELRSTVDPQGNPSADVIEQANPGELKPAHAMVFFGLIGATMLILYATLMALNGHAVRSTGNLEQGAPGLTFRNSHEGIELTVPTGWNPFRSEDALAALQTDGYSLIAEEQFGTYSVDTMLSATEVTVSRGHSDATFSPFTATLAGRSASGFETSYNNSEDLSIHQRVLGVRRGYKIFILIETWRSSEDRAIFDAIERSVRFR
jgi:hypothetical protein